MKDAIEYIQKTCHEQNILKSIDIIQSNPEQACLEIKRGYNFILNGEGKALISTLSIKFLEQIKAKV